MVWAGLGAGLTASWAVRGAAGLRGRPHREPKEPHRVTPPQRGTPAMPPMDLPSPRSPPQGPPSPSPLPIVIPAPVTPMDSHVTPPL